jgi:DNA integrity scanning protein DisA with diadenylate cyclase activity
MSSNRTYLKKGITVVLRQNAGGEIFMAFTYIDFRTKCVFNGSDLGKEFSAKRIIEKCCQQQQVLTNSQIDKSQLIDLKEEKDVSINNSKGTYCT